MHAFVPKTTSLSWTTLLALTTASLADISFDRDVRPILSDRCFHCHGPAAENQKSDFRLDTEAHARADLGGYAGIVPGNLKKSEVHFRIHSDDDDEIMPPLDSNRTLSDAEKGILDQWIQEGAKYDTHWALKPVPAAIKAPEATSDWASNTIDHFIVAKMNAAGLRPAAESTREKWLRRVTFDLTGLPPTIAEIDAFLASRPPAAYAQIVDRLLDSDAYAERMATEWMDVARYSDTYGYQRDSERFVWPWRDWLIRAFRTNMPYSEFMTLQLAGDLMPDATPDQILATTFNRLHSHKKEGGSDLEEFRVEYVADRTQTASAAFLGMTMECARCHDHKYDPIPTRDYYRMSAFFANIAESGMMSFFTDAVPTPAMPYINDTQRQEFDIATAAIQDAEKALSATTCQPAFDAWLHTLPQQLTWPGMTAQISFDALESHKLRNDILPDHPAKCPEVNTIVSGKFDQALQLTGDDAVKIPNVGVYHREHPFAVSLWINISNASPRAVVYHRTKAAEDAGSLGYDFLLLDGKPTATLAHFWPGDAIRVQAENALAPNAWHHVVVNYDGSSKAAGLNIFINGKAAKTRIVRDHLTRRITNKENLTIGERFRDRGFKHGKVDAFSMFDRALAPIEIAQLYDGTTLEGLLARPATDLSKAEQSMLLTYFQATISKEMADARTKLHVARAAWNRKMDGVRSIMVMRDMKAQRPTYVLTRGGYNDRGEEVTAGTPTALPPMPPDLPKNRLGLARWLTADNNPLTARVTVNRYWQMIFGMGLVRTPEDFGSQGAPPSHPELLDWLARDFMDNNWDVHRLLKQMVLSSTYRQSTVVTPAAREIDPTNQWLARTTAARLPAEMIRDNALAVSGLLVRKVGGAPVKPYDLALSFSPIKPASGDGLYRRSVYTFWKRTAPAPMMMTLDATKRDVCRLNRDVTASPLQPLVLLNAPQFVEAARVLAAQLIQHHGENSPALLEDAFRRLTSRYPTAPEKDILSDMFDQQIVEFRDHPDMAKAYLAVGDTKTDATLPDVQLAAATVVVNALMNFEECVTRR
ncbi:MAG: hypothetical protein ACI9X0_000295 [Kiritimatiellia bacterium]|jgi:hypothetical protein